MSKKYSNKGYHARTAVQPKKDNTNTIIALITAGLCLAVIAAVVIAIVVATGTPESTVDMDEVTREINSFNVSDFAETENVTDYVKITVKGYGDIVLRLRPDVAPKSVANFQKLVKNGHYEGKIFHRVIQEFMIQGGGYDGTNTLHKADTVQGEFKSNGVQNDLLHVRGVISMARTDDPDSASNQFFICDATSEHLNGKYAAFGYVLAGMDTVDKIAAVETNGSDKPLENVIILSVTFVEPLK